MADIIFLHGASSSGKSTLARALQASLPMPFWHVSIDHLRDSGAVPVSRFRNGDFDWRAARPAFFDGFHASLAAYADAGNNLILEHILDTPAFFDDVCRQLRGHKMLFVAVHCDLDVLNARERQRGDRPIGSAEADFATIHAGLSYDLEVNGQDDVSGNVEKVISAWRTGQRRSSFTTTP